MKTRTIVILAFFLGCGIGFWLITVGLTATKNTPQYALHLPLIVMGVLSYVVTLPAPKAWWMVAALIGFAPLGMFGTSLAASEVRLLFAEAVVLAFGPALLAYFIARK